MLVALDARQQPRQHQRESQHHPTDEHHGQPRLLRHGRFILHGRVGQEQHENERGQEEGQQARVGRLQIAGEHEAHAAPTRVAQAKLQRGAPQRGPERHEDRERDPLQTRHEMGHSPVSQTQQEHDDVAAKHLPGVGMKPQRVAAHQRVVLEVRDATGARKRHIERERDQREQQVDDPDAKVLAARAGEPDVQQLRRSGCAALLMAQHHSGRKIVLFVHPDSLKFINWGAS